MSTINHNAKRASLQHGSILVLTLLAIGMIAGAYLYVAVIGSRSAETTRARTAADAAAMAAATIKARTLNYEAFILLADTVLLPLGQVSQNIVAAQDSFKETVCEPCFAAGPEYCMLFEQCQQFVIQQMPKTAGSAPGVDETVTTWLDGLEAMASALDSVGPYWAEEQAVLIGTSSSYHSPGNHGVTGTASFPLPDNYQECGRLGVDMISNMQNVQGRNACHDSHLLGGFMDGVYLCPPGTHPFTCLANYTGMAEIGKLLEEGASCGKQKEVPRLADNWQKFKYSRGMSLETKPNDHWQLGYLEALRQTRPPKMLETGWLLGMGCAEHYEQDHPGEESLWHMDWRARLVPCEYDKEENANQVMQCGGASAPLAMPMQLQFSSERMLGIAKDWKW